MNSVTPLSTAERIAVPGFVIDLSRAELRTAEGAFVELRPRSFAVLRLLALNLGRLVPKDVLMAEVWDDAAVTEDSLTQCIADIRRALGDRDRQLVRTVPRRGYMLIGAGDERGRAAPPLVQGTQLETRYARSGDTYIAYQVSGDGPIDLVFVQGYVTHLEIEWEDPRPAALYRALGRFCRLIRFDKRGTGLSDRVAGLPTLEERMDDVRAVMDAAGSRRAVLLGSSEGGPMSLLFAATHPDRVQSLALYGAMARIAHAPDHPWGRSPDQLKAMVRGIEEKWGSGHSVDVFAPSIASLPEYRAWRGRLDRSAASPGAAIALARMNFEIDVRHLLPSIRVPTLVVHRTGDVAVAVDHSRHLARAIPRARYVELPGRDHAPWVGDTDTLVALIQDFALTSDSSDTADEPVLTTVLVLNGVDDASIRREAALFRGTPMASEGNLACTFDGPARAVRCALAVLAATPGARAGVHTGDVKVHVNQLTGPGLCIARAIADIAASGEVLVSVTVRDLVAGAGFVFSSRGKVRLEEHSINLAVATLESPTSPSQTPSV
jgi:pimeloyl-ACP methyl ester carboxylesterase/DNA-binding winged helix-turn-helix (wHTH) protein